MLAAFFWKSAKVLKEGMASEGFHKIPLLGTARTGLPAPKHGGTSVLQGKNQLRLHATTAWHLEGLFGLLVF